MSPVAVVVPTSGRLALLHRCLAALVEQDLPPAEVVVVHHGDDAVVRLVASFVDRLPVRAVGVAATGAAPKRNAGWRAVTAPLVAFTDDDCAPGPGWLAALAAGRGDLLHGPVAPHPDDAAVDSAFARTLDVPAPTRTYPTANLAVRRDALEAVGGFDETLHAGEDTDLAWRVLATGADAEWLPAAVVLHAVRPATFPQHLASLWRWRSLPEVVRRHPVLRTELTHGLFWKPQHRQALLAVAGLAVATRHPVGLLGVVPLLTLRWRARGPRFGTQDAVADVVELGVLAVGSVAARSVVL